LLRRFWDSLNATDTLWWANFATLFGRLQLMSRNFGMPRFKFGANWSLLRNRG